MTILETILVGLVELSIVANISLWVYVRKLEKLLDK